MKRQNIVYLMMIIVVLIPQELGYLFNIKAAINFSLSDGGLGTIAGGQF